MKKKKMQSLKKLVLMCGLSLLAFGCKGESAASPYDSLYEDLPFEMPRIKAPVFPSTTVSVSDFGGKGNGIELNTEAFRLAIDDLVKRGGGTLLVPSGVWLTGPIELKSNINLHLTERAILLFSPDKDLYPLVETSFEGLDTRRCQSPISARDAENVAITGQGAIDGNGEVWRPLKREKVSDSQWRRITSRGGAYKRPTYWMPSAAYLHGDTISEMNVPRQLHTEEEWQAVRDFLRPVMVSFLRCKNVFLQGPIFQNSPAWNIHPLACENVIIDGIQVRNPSYAQNGDGLDLESCRNVLVVNSTFDVGDDGICIKSGKDDDGRRRGMPCENVIVSNCTVFKGHGGFVVGSEMSGGVRNILVKDCQFLGTDVGLRFKSRRGRGGIVENIYISNINMIDIATDAVHFNLHYGGKSVSEDLKDGKKQAAAAIPSVNEETPVFRNIFIRDVHCNNARRAAHFHGLPEQPIDRIEMENITISSRTGIELIYSRNIRMRNIEVKHQEGELLTLREVENIDSPLINQ